MNHTWVSCDKCGTVAQIDRHDNFGVIIRTDCFKCGGLMEWGY